MTDRRLQIAADIRQRILSGLHLGRLGPGARLWSTREIADELNVAPRTIMAAYRVLEAEGLVELRERSGIYVAPGHDSGALLSQLAGWVVGILLDARSRDLSPIEFPERVRRCLQTLQLRAACVAGNFDQMDQICAELREDYGISSTGVSPADLATGAQMHSALTQADLLVTTAAYTVETHRVAKQLGKVAITVTLRSELMGEMTRWLGRGPVYIIGTDPRFRDALQSLFAPAGLSANLRPIILGEDDPGLIPEDAVTYFMRTAHERLRDTPLAKRVVPIKRVFSNDMARDLLEFIVRANMAALSARGMPL